MDETKSSLSRQTAVPDAGRHDSRRLAHPTPRHPQTPALAILTAAWPRLSLADQKAILAIVRRAAEK